QRERAVQGPHDDPAASPAESITFRVRDAKLTALLPAFPQNVPPGRYVVVEVEDAGCGMTAEVLNQALDPFFTPKEVGQGTGLGRPVVFGIVQGHQGYLPLRSELGLGTCISLYLPRMSQAAVASLGRAAEAGLVLEPEAAPGYNILVVDDEEAVLD